MGDSSHPVQPSARLDHLIVASPWVDRTSADLATRLGVVPATGGRHRAWSTRNTLVSLGPRRYLEVLGPDERPDPGSGELPEWIAGLRAPRLATWAVSSDDLEGDHARVREAGVDLGAILEAGRQRTDGSTIRWRMTDLAVSRLDGIVPFLIHWDAEIHPGDSSPAGCRVVELRAVHPDPDRVTAAHRALGVSMEVRRGSEATLIATLETPRGRVELR